MLRKGFNKIGGTELRTKTQVPTYAGLLALLEDKLLDSDGSAIKDGVDRNEYEMALVKWLRDEGLYEYKSADDGPVITPAIRGKTLVNYMKKIGLIAFPKPSLVCVSDTVKSFRGDKYNAIFACLQRSSFNAPNMVKPFLTMLEFVNSFESNASSLDVGRLALAFMVYDGNESFSSLYSNENLIQEMAAHNSSEIYPRDRYAKKRKKDGKPGEALLIDSFYSQFVGNSEPLDESMFELISKDCAPVIFSILKIDPKAKDLVAKSVAALNKLGAKSEFLPMWEEHRLRKLLSGDYLDLFCRWLIDFKLVFKDERSSYIFYDWTGLTANNGSYFTLQKRKEPSELPYSLLETTEFLRQIQMNDYSFKDKFQELVGIERATLAEYFVSLYLSHRLGLNALEFDNFSRTIKNQRLQPITHAPGRQPDMIFELSNGSLVCGEVTLLRSSSEVIEHESYPVARHFINAYLSKRDSTTSNTLIFVWPNAGGVAGKEKVKHAFEKSIDVWLNQYNEQDFSKEVYLLSFDELLSFDPRGQ